MSDTVTKQVLAAVTTRLEVIRTTAGYNTNAGASVYRGRRQFQPTELPAISIFALEEDYSDTGHADRMSNTLTIRINVHDDLENTDNPQDKIQDLVGDVKKALFLTDRGLSGLLSDLKPIRVATTTPDDVSQSVAAVIIAAAEYPEMYGDPYTVI